MSDTEGTNKWITDGRWPNPEEWADYFTTLPHEKRIKLAEMVLSSMQDASHCFMEAHGGELRHLHEYIAKQQDKILLGRWLLAEARDRAATYHALLKLSGNDPN